MFEQRIGNDGGQVPVEEQRKTEGRQEHAEGHRQRADRTAAEVSDEGRKDDQRRGQDSRERDAVEEITFRHPPAAFDRVLPEKVADVSEKRHVPVWALILMLVPSIAVGALYAYTSNFSTYILDATLVIAVTFFGTAIAAMILPYRKKSLYANSPIARYKVLGLPLITVTGFVTAAFLGFNLWHWFTNDLYAVNNTDSLWFMGIMYALALVIYIVAKVYRKRQGIDLSAVYREIPVE